MQFRPSPWYPLRQRQTWDPSVFVQAALGSHWFDSELPHSSKSGLWIKDRCYYEIIQNGKVTRFQVNTDEIAARDIYQYSFVHHPDIHWDMHRGKIHQCWYTKRWDHTRLFQGLHIHPSLWSIKKKHFCARLFCLKKRLRFVRQGSTSTHKRNKCDKY